MDRGEVIFVNMMINISSEVISDRRESARAKKLSLSLEISKASGEFINRILKSKKLFVKIGSCESRRADRKAEEANTSGDFRVFAAMGR